MAMLIGIGGRHACKKLSFKRADLCGFIKSYQNSVAFVALYNSEYVEILYFGLHLNRDQSTIILPGVTNVVP